MVTRAKHEPVFLMTLAGTVLLAAAMAVQIQRAGNSADSPGAPHLVYRPTTGTELADALEHCAGSGQPCHPDHAKLIALCRKIGDRPAFEAIRAMDAADTGAGLPRGPGPGP